MKYSDSDSETGCQSVFIGVREKLLRLSTDLDYSFLFERGNRLCRSRFLIILIKYLIFRYPTESSLTQVKARGTVSVLQIQ